jgi:hypothetical protein
MVTGGALRRLTQLIPDHDLPTVDSLPEAVGHIAATMQARTSARQHEPRRRTPSRDIGFTGFDANLPLKSFHP